MPHAVPVALSLLDSRSLLSGAGALAVFLILFAETGLLIGFFLPGDTLLFTAGVLCATSGGSAGHLSLAAVLPAAAAGALAGAQAGFWIGRQAGHVLDRPGRPRLVAAVHRAHAAMDRFGVRRAIVLARFIPVVRTVINPVAGAAGVPAGIFALWQVIGGLIWTVGVTMAGYALGSRISGIDRYLLPVVGVIVVASLIPVLIEVLRRRSATASPGGGDPQPPAGSDPQPPAGSDEAGPPARTGPRHPPAKERRS
jgi:membrane-associated protein